MILPNKLIPYNKSILAKMIYILDMLILGDEHLEILYNKIKDNFEDINQYILTLDVLFSLEKIQIDEELKVLKYVKTDNL
ncbi:ABC-three component system middle component 7 [Clostridium lacusfryxellense]|uniref:ABC-three component system middle component 7 n=1 Tax=Clostridium lacusfryxellense TaxID=205328 RepID=UPI001C0B0F39|nr:ABC-three component system middle component 7 [Clostridium lacusfryxellense]MBU3110828.1 hypothetical protein [Clostridium lacusfryxellense]